MSRRFAAALLLCACGASPGRHCSEDSACGDELICLKPAGGANGICTFRFAGQGDRCLSGGDCGPGLFCSNDLSTGTRQFSGACRPLQGEGAPCLKSSNCQPPLQCDGAGAESLGSCRPPG